MAKLQERFPDIVFQKLVAPAGHPGYKYDGFKPSVQTLPKGHTREPGRLAFGVDTIFERDVGIKLRDNTTIYTDVFRPAAAEKEGAKVPAIIPWSPYGKTGRGPQNYDSMGPFRCGIPLEITSGYEKFEAPDPAEWCKRGYAIINVDARGAGDSEGDIHFWGQQEAEDMYDTVEWVSKQPWSNGSVAFAGNSWLAISQINFASRLSHPAVKALAPWEAMNNVYKDTLARGGIPNVPFSSMILKGFAGHSRVEDMPGMYYKHPLYDDYWQEKAIKVENIKDIPLYLTASYSTGLYSRGSFETFEKAQTPLKWLRVHPYQEWYDIYRPEVTDELQKFFDRYCKGVDNGWEQTPRLRLSLISFDSSPAKTVVERPEPDGVYPLPRTKEVKYHLDAASKTLSTAPPAAEASASYEAHSLTDTLDFALTFPTYTELAGYPTAHLHLSNPDHTDLDVVVQLRKVSRTGELLTSCNYPVPVAPAQVPDTNVAKFVGPQGKLRASHAITKSVSTASDGRRVVTYGHDRQELIEPVGKVVALEIPIWPVGMVFEEGEGLVLRIAGHDLAFPEVEMLRPTAPEDENVGKHVVHTGGRYESFVVLPVIS